VLHLDPLTPHQLAPSPSSFCSVPRPIELGDPLPTRSCPPAGSPRTDSVGASTIASAGATRLVSPKSRHGEYRGGPFFVQPPAGDYTRGGIAKCESDATHGSYGGAQHSVELSRILGVPDTGAAGVAHNPAKLAPSGRPQDRIPRGNHTHAGRASLHSSIDMWETLTEQLWEALDEPDTQHAVGFPQVAHQPALARSENGFLSPPPPPTHTAHGGFAQGPRAVMK